MLVVKGRKVKKEGEYKIAVLLHSEVGDNPAVNYTGTHAMQGPTSPFPGMHPHSRHLTLNPFTLPPGLDKKDTKGEKRTTPPPPPKKRQFGN